VVITVETAGKLEAYSMLVAMLESLSRAERMLLLRFVCAFAWTDLKVTDKERKFVKRLVDRLGLSGEDAEEVEAWIHVAPAPGSVDASLVPADHRRAFVETVRAMIYADGNVDDEERAQFEKLRSALSG
jgi:uncharacterized tellurite resistance protein B-like protein